MSLNMFRFIVFTFAFLAITTSDVKAFTQEEKQKIMIYLIPHIGKCSEDFTPTEGIVESILTTGKLDGINFCFASCVLKSIGIFDANGRVNEDKEIELSKEFLPSEGQQNFAKFIDNCHKVNEMEVSDGDKGCDRAKLLIECALPYALPYFAA